ncbi:aspartate aminotransferase domain protein [Mycobacterium xenopi 3993]|nr:aspartate aminotransferase domain protein [Mycobacterium xenopi 3993]
MITGPKDHASSFIEGISLLANMRLCPNVPAQHGIQVALAATRASRIWCCPVAGCSSSAMSPGPNSTRSQACPASNRRCAVHVSAP